MPRSKSRVQIPSPAPSALKAFFRPPSPAARDYSEERLGFGARYPSGKGEVCKTFMRRFDSDPRLHHSFISLVLGPPANCSALGAFPPVNLHKKRACGKQALRAGWGRDRRFLDFNNETSSARWEALRNAHTVTALLVLPCEGPVLVVAVNNDSAGRLQR